MTTTILLADDHSITREGLKSLIARAEHMEIIGEADNGRIAVEKALELAPDLVILDISMPELNGIQAATQILKKRPETKILALSMFADRRYVTSMLKAGASGYLLKNCISKEIIDAVNTINRGRRYLSPEIQEMVMDDFINGRHTDEDFQINMLTCREKEILQLISEGFGALQIADRLHISEKTVSTHRRKIMDKLNVHTVAGLTKVAIREGLTRLAD